MIKKYTLAIKAKKEDILDRELFLESIKKFKIPSLEGLKAFQLKIYPNGNGQVEDLENYTGAYAVFNMEVKDD